MQLLRDWLREAPFSLGLSAGFFGFFAHCGVVTALEEAGLRPEKLSGSSAGALIAGLWAAGVEPDSMRYELTKLKREDFWDPAPGLGILRGRLFQQKLQHILPVRSFAECRTKLSISVYDVFSGKTLALQEGPLAPAIQASCTLPVLFQPYWHQGRPLLDGGIFDRAGLLGIPPGTRVFHHHLTSRSPWRRKNSPLIAPPKQPGLVGLLIGSLPRVSPFHLHRGEAAFTAAYRTTRKALEQPIEDGTIHLEAEPP